MSASILKLNDPFSSIIGMAIPSADQLPGEVSVRVLLIFIVVILVLVGYFVVHIWKVYHEFKLIEDKQEDKREEKPQDVTDSALKILDKITEVNQIFSDKYASKEEIVNVKKTLNEKIDQNKRNVDEKIRKLNLEIEKAKK